MYNITAQYAITGMHGIFSHSFSTDDLTEENIICILSEEAAAVIGHPRTVKLITYVSHIAS
jgi:hypothetical protein